METAVPSSDIIRTFKKIEETVLPAEKVAEKSDAQIGLLAQDPRWMAFQEVIDGMITSLEAVENIEVNDSVEAVGFKFLVSRLAAAQLKAIRNLPDAIAQGVHDGGRETGEE